jgi:hypothetical protein
MSTLKPELLKIGGLLATGIVSAAVLDSDGVKSSCTEIVKSLAPNFVHQFVSSLDYNRLRDFLIKPHPGSLNHDLDRLVKDAMVKAIGYFNRLYIDKLEEEEHLSFWKKHTSKPFKEIKKALKDLEDDLKSDVEADLTLVDANRRLGLKDYLDTGSPNSFAAIADYLFSISALNENQEQLNKIKSAFIADLPSLFDLCYKEALKDKSNEAAFKAFQIWLLEENYKLSKNTNEVNIDILKGQVQLLEEVKALKENHSTDATLKVEAMLDQQIKSLNKTLESNFNKVLDKLNLLHEDVKDVKVSADEILSLVRGINVKPVPGTSGQMANPQPFLIYDYTHQNQSDNSAIFRRRFLPFVGREDEMQLLHEFFNNGSKLEWQLVTSAGGSGKSRLAMEFCFELAAINKEYSLGFYKDINNSSFIDWHQWQPINKTLIVIDYVSTMAQDCLNALSAIYLRSNNLNHDVRFLFLEREAHGDWWKKFESHIASGLIPKQSAASIDLKPMQDDELVAIINHCLQAKNKPLLSENTKQEVLHKFKEIDRQARPLFAFYVGKALAHNSDIRNWKIENLLENHLQREELQYLQHENKDLLEKHKNLVALATMMTYITHEEMEKICSKNCHYLPTADELDVDVYEAISDIDDNKYKALEPDILGEYWVLKQLQADPKQPLKNKDKAKDIINLAWTIDPRSTNYFTIRFYQDFHTYDFCKQLLKLQENADENTLYEFCSMFLDLSGVLVVNGYMDDALQIWTKIKTIAYGNYSTRILITKVQAAYNLALNFGKNNEIERANAIYGEISTMADENHEPAVMNEILINKVKAAYNLALHFGNNNEIEKANTMYGEICAMADENHEPLVMNEILISKVKAAYNLALHFGNNKEIEKANAIYGEIRVMADENHEPAVMNEILINKVKAAYNLALNFGKNNEIERANAIYGEISAMTDENHEPAVMNEILINKVKAAYNLALHFGSNNEIERANAIYGEIKAMTDENHEPAVMNEILICKVKAANNLALHFGNNNEIEKANTMYGEICAMADENHEPLVMSEILINKVKAAYNLALHFGKNNEIASANAIYGEIRAMADDNHEPVVMNEILINKVQAAYNLALHFGNNNEIERANAIYGEISTMADENHEPAVMNEILIKKVKAAYNLAFHFGINNEIERANAIYGEIKAMADENHEPAVMNEILINKVNAAYSLVFHFGKNNEIERANAIYDEIKAMADENTEPAVMNEILINKVKAAFNLAVHFGNNNEVEKANAMYGEISTMADENHEPVVMNEILRLKSMLEEAFKNEGISLGE